MKRLFLATAVLGITQSFAADEVSECAAVKKAFNPTAIQIKTLMETQRAADKVPAITYSVFSDSCVVDSGHLPQSNAQLSANNSIFRIASVSKLFATISISQLIERGIISPNTKILTLTRAEFVDYLLKNETPARLEKWSKITIQDLMSHQAGISKDLPGSFDFFNSQSVAGNSYSTIEQFYNSLTKTEFLFPAGNVPTGIKYSNLGINILARIVEAYNSRGLSYQVYVKENILKPLGMNTTFYDIPEGMKHRMINGFGNMLKTGERTPVTKVYNVGSYDGSIGVATTALDLAKLGKEMLRMMDNQSIILKNPAVIEKFFKMRSKASSTIGWAHGPIAQTLPGETFDKNAIWFGHTGTGISERAVLLVSPEKNLGVVALFNVTDVNREKYVKIVSDLVEYTDSPMTVSASKIFNSARAFLKSTPAPTLVKHGKESDPLDLEKFAGVYSTDIIGEQKVTVSNDGYLEFYGQKLKVENLEKGQFRFPPILGPAGVLFNSEPVNFIFDKQKNVIGIRAAQIKKYKKIN